MSKEITIDKLTIGNKLTSREVDSTDIFVDGISVKEALKKLPPTWVKSVNNTLPDTNGNIQIEVGNKDSEYSSWQVFATDEVIPAGTISRYADNLLTTYKYTTAVAKDAIVKAYKPYDEETKDGGHYVALRAKVAIEAGDNAIIPFETPNWEDSWSNETTTGTPLSIDNNIKYAVEYNPYITVGEDRVLVGRTESFVIRSSYRQEDSDVIVDWGDGNVSAIANLEKSYIESDDGNYEYNIQLDHTYENNGYYEVKVFGKRYWGLRHEQLKSDVVVTSKIPSIMCQCFTERYHIAQHVLNVSRFATKCSHLLQVQMPSYTPTTVWVNASQMFEGSKNLKYALGLDKFATVQQCCSANSMFKDCTALEWTDAHVPAYGEQNWNFSAHSGFKPAATSMFSNCTSLKSNPAALLPPCGFLGDGLYFSDLFKNCLSMSTTKTYYNGKIQTVTATNTQASLAARLWNAESHRYYGSKDTLFSTCSDEVRALVPTTWGGTKQV